MIEARIDTFTEHFLFVEEPVRPKLESAEVCMACGTEEVVRLSKLKADDLDARSVGRNGLSLVTGALAEAWFRRPGRDQKDILDLRSKYMPIDEIVLGVTSFIMVSTITFILGWEIGLIAAIFFFAKSYRQKLINQQMQLANTDKERQRLWDQHLEGKVLDRRRKVWERLGYCRECGTVHDTAKRRFTSWYNMLELFDK